MLPLLFIVVHALADGAPASAPAELEELPELPALGATTTSASAPALAHDKTAAEHLREWLTGNFRLTGAFLRYGDRQLVPAGDDGLLLCAVRALVNHDLDSRFGLEVNYFADFTRSPQASSASAFSSAGTTSSPYRTPYLVWRYWQNGAVIATTGVDRLALRFRHDIFSLTVGRFPVTYSVTSFFTPNDFFSPFAATSVNKLYKPGVDALRLGLALGQASSLEVVGVLGNTLSDNGTQGVPSWGESGLLGYARTLVHGFELSVLGGKVAERWVVGGALQGDLGPIGLRGEGHVGFPDKDGRGRSGADLDKPIHGRFAVGPNINVNWHALSFAVQYAFFSDGALLPADYSSRALRAFPDDLPYLGKHYVGAFAGLDVIPILHANLLSLVNAGDGSGIAGLSLLYNAANEVDLIGGLYVPWGKHAQSAPGMAQGGGIAQSSGLTLGSELGSGPLVAYFEARVSF